MDETVGKAASTPVVRRNPINPGLIYPVCSRRCSFVWGREGQGHLDYSGTPFFFSSREGVSLPVVASTGGKTAETGIKRASESGSGNLRELISWRQRRPVSSDSAYRLASFLLRGFILFGSARLPRALLKRSAVWDTVNAILLWSTVIGRCEPIGDEII